MYMKTVLKLYSSEWSFIISSFFTTIKKNVTSDKITNNVSKKKKIINIAHWINEQS